MPCALSSAGVLACSVVFSLSFVDCVTLANPIVMHRCSEPTMAFDSSLFHNMRLSTLTLGFWHKGIHHHLIDFGFRQWDHLPG
ncbi:hypothetical protein C8F04DRAFT_1120650 [Mycena alexandri]|uniref:Secreted protein n=1 Tax=Mycena alexandri TaxID=1745969 RepID=A0AAD6SH87_9AGAR|nr:hypothetical protein C8F04DRAFT_1120650 [Mycena alexandri]